MVLWCWKFRSSPGKNRKLSPRLIDVIAEKGRFVHIFASKKDFCYFYLAFGKYLDLYVACIYVLLVSIGLVVGCHRKKSENNIPMYHFMILFRTQYTIKEVRARLFCISHRSLYLALTITVMHGVLDKKQNKINLRLYTFKVIKFVKTMALSKPNLST